MINEKDKIEINTKNNYNLLWALFQSNNLNINIDKINQNEVKKPDIKKEIEKIKKNYKLNE